MKSKHFLFWVALCCSTLSIRAQVSPLDSAISVYDSLQPYVSSGVLLERSPDYIYAGASDYNPIYYGGSSDSLGIERKFKLLYNLMYYASYSDSVFDIHPNDLDSIVDYEYFNDTRKGKTTQELLNLEPVADIMLGFIQTPYQFMSWEMDTNTYYNPIRFDSVNNKFILNIGTLNFQDSIIIDTTYYDAVLDSTITIDTAYLASASMNVDADTVVSKLFERREMLILSTLVDNRVCLAQNEPVTFRIPSNLVITNPDCMFICRELHIDFDDGNGIVPVTPDALISITYPTYGTKTIRAYVYDSVNQEYLYPASSPTKVFVSKCVLGKEPDDNIVNPDFNPCNIPDGGYGTGESVAWVKYKKNGAQAITKPVILVEGFESGKFDAATGPEYDLGSKYGFGDINWRSLTSGGFPSYAKQLKLLPYFADSMLSIGYDVIFFDLRTNRAKIQKNANSLINLIQYVNAVLDSNGSDEEIIVIAPSMGGIISRYAIRKMELHDCCHNIRLWFSFNGQHHGATIPLGLQEMLWALGTDFNPPEDEGIRAGDAAKATYVNVMNAPVTRQLLVYHREPTAILDHEQLYGELDSMGYPEVPRIFALISGSDQGRGLNSDPTDITSPIMQPGTKLLEMDFKVTPPLVFPDLFVFPILTYNNLTWNSPQSTDVWTFARAQAYSVLHDPNGSVNQMILERGRYIRGNINHLVLGQGGIYVTGLGLYITNIIVHRAAIAAAAPSGCFPCLAFEASKLTSSLIISGATTTALLANWGINEAINNDPKWDVKHQFSSLNYEGAPGDYNDALGRVADLSNGLIKAHFRYHTFSPSVSCLGIDTNDLFINIRLNKEAFISEGVIPFEDYHVNVDDEGTSINQPHVDITPSVIKWVLDKIRATEAAALDGANGSAYTLDEYYNLGRPFDIQNATDLKNIPLSRIPAIEIENNGELFINKFDSVGFRLTESFPTREFSTFNIEANDDICDSIYVKVKNGGLFCIGDDNYIVSQGDIINNRANVHIGENTPIEIEAGGRLRINDNSSLIMDKGSKIILHPGAIIELDGDNSVLEINGKVILKENADFKFTGNGYLRFGQAMTSSNISEYWELEGNNEFHVNGTGFTDLKMQIVDNLYLPAALDSCIIDSSMIKIATNKRLAIQPSLYFHDNYVSSFDSIFRGHSLTLFGQEYASVKGSYFEHLQIGINASLISQGNDLTIEDCGITKNGDGVVSTGWGIHFKNSVVNDNDHNGWKANDVSTTSSAYLTEFNQNGDDGISINSASTISILNLTESELNQNQNGLHATAMDVRMNCTRVSTNTNNGIYSTNGKIIINSDAGNWINHNTIGIWIVECDELSMKGGRNQFSNTSYDIFGDFSLNSHNTLIQDANGDWFLNVFDNHIPADGSGNANIFMEVNDFPTIETVGLFNWTANVQTAGSACLPPASTSYYGTTLGGRSGRTINTTNYFNTDIVTAVLNAMSYVSSENSISDDLLGITLLKEILDAPLESPTEDEQVATDIAFQLMLKALSNAYNNGDLDVNRAEGGSSEDPYLTMVITEIDNRIANIDPTDEFAYTETYELTLQKAHMYRLSEHYDYAYTVLSQAEQWSSAEDLFNTQYWECVVQNEEAYLLEEITLEDFEEEIINCQAELSSSRIGMPPAGLKTTIYRPDIENFAKFRLSPNPAQNYTIINFSDIVEGEVSVTIFNSNSNVVNSLKTGMYGRDMKINTSDLSSGVYFVEIYVNGKSLGAEKLVIN